MEASGTTPRTGLGAVDAPEIAATLDATAPFVSVYLALETAVPQASQRNELTWQSVRAALADAGAPTPALDAIDPLIADAHHEGPGLGIVADADAVRLVRHGATGPARHLGRIGHLPYLAPLIAWQQRALPHVVVVADHAGAEVYAIADGRDAARHEAGRTDPHDPILRSRKPGGWSQRRFEERARNAWRTNAQDTADTVARACDDTAARFVALVGDVRTRRLVVEQLPDRYRDIVHEIEDEHGVQPGSADVGQATERLLDTIVASDTVALVEKLREELGQADRGVEGAEPTLGALAAAQVDTLLVVDDPDDERTAWIGRAPNVVAGDAGSVEAMGDRAPVIARLTDAAIRAALGTGAAVRVVPKLAALPSGIGAILRVGR